MATELALRGEAAALGLAVHYPTGITLTHVYHEALRRCGREPGVPSATAFGAATALLPMLILYPSWGIGPFGLGSDETARLVRIMLLGHTAFGTAIGVWTRLLCRRADDETTVLVEHKTNCVTGCSHYATLCKAQAIPFPTLDELKRARHDS